MSQLTVITSIGRLLIDTGAQISFTTTAVATKFGTGASESKLFKTVAGPQGRSAAISGTADITLFAVIDQLQRQLNALPSRALGGFSPYQYAFGVPPKPLFWLPATDDNEHQQQENINIALDSIRFIADSCCDTIALNRAADSAETSNNISFSEGDMVALHQADRPNSLAPHFSGPYQVVDHSGEGWYTVCEVLADDNLGPGIILTSSTDLALQTATSM